MADYLATRQDARYADPLIVSHGGAALTTAEVSQLVGRTLNRRPHDLREAFAAHLLNEGRVSPEIVCELLGDSDEAELVAA